MDGRSGDRIPVQARLSAPVQVGPGAGIMYDGYRVSFPDVQWQGRSVKRPTLSTATVKDIVQLYRYSACLRGKLQGEFYFILLFYFYFILLFYFYLFYFHFILLFYFILFYFILFYFVILFYFYLFHFYFILFLFLFYFILLQRT